MLAQLVAVVTRSLVTDTYVISSQNIQDLTANTITTHKITFTAFLTQNTYKKIT